MECKLVEAKKRPFFKRKLKLNIKKQLFHIFLTLNTKSICNKEQLEWFSITVESKLWVLFTKYWSTLKNLVFNIFADFLALLRGN